MRHDILIAVGQYDAASVTDITACERDIAALAKRLATIPSMDGESPLQTIVSTATRLDAAYKTNILTSLEQALAPVTPADTILVAFSCHGLTVAGTNYLLPADGSPDDVEKCVPFEWVKGLLDGATCRFKVIIVDACHSGDSRMVFKKGVKFGFDDESVVAALIAESRGVLYASACGHDQYAYIRPDGVESVWMHAISSNLARRSGAECGGAIVVNDVIADAAVETSGYVRQYFKAEQTPFSFFRAEGVIPLGMSSGTSAADLKPQSLGALTRDAFRRQFEAAFGHSMPLEFDVGAEARLAEEGWSLAVVIHIGPSKLRGRIGVLFDAMTQEAPTMDDLEALQRVAERRSLDFVVVPRDDWPADLRRRAATFGRIRLAELPRFAPVGPTLFRDYFVPAEHARDDIVQANCNSTGLLTDMGKLFHIVLADLAAPTYDEQYGDASFGTQRAMAFEEELVDSTIARMDQTKNAVDLGCGTGRHTFRLAERFDKVAGYDFSPGMIRVATEKKRQMIVDEGRTLEIDFEVRDIEEEPLQFEGGTLDLVIGCFGMGSFIRDPVPFLSGIKEQLRPDGKLVLSFYNADALVYQAPPPWRDNALSAALVPGRDELEVTLPGGERFRIFCRPYRFDLLKGQLSRIFDTVKIWSCPAFASFLPGDFFVRGPNSVVARSVIESVDRNLAVRADLPIGAYFTAVCTKTMDDKAPSHTRVASQAILSLRGEKALLSELSGKKISFERIEHRRVRNVDDVRRELGVDGSNLVKAILAVEKDGAAAPVVLVLQGSRRLDIEKVSRWLGLTPRQWRFATQKEVQRVYGLEIGGVPPFGYKDEVRIGFDVALSRESAAICGIGNPQCSIRLKMADLIAIAKAEIADISSP